ncbi:hypothetical protein WL94_10415 [Burkholderia cepacia]|uniref:MFS transporter n=1 Tax=Burkholderia cepacia TaxID=292 RepID=UPI0007545F9E|nr:MFS transporter [Burkholderia cepacia]KWF94590.1 hypothetical protein WL94_10415 [Burkholderia cepacia]
MRRKAIAFQHYYPWFLVFVLFCTSVVSYLDRNIIALFVGPIRHEIGLSDVQISLLQGVAFALFYSVMGLPFGRRVDRHTRRNLIAAGVFDVHLKGRDGQSASMPIVNANASYYVRPDVVLGFRYWHANFRAAQTHYDNVNVSADYFLSKSTDVFISPVYEHASGRGLAQLFQLGSASGGNQFAVDIGIRHNF